MVKFGKRMASEVAAEWAAGYVSYDTLKGFIYEHIDAPLETEQHKYDVEGEFLELVRSELARTDDIFSGIVDRLIASAADLKAGGDAPRTTAYEAEETSDQASVSSASHRLTSVFLRSIGDGYRRTPAEDNLRVMCNDWHSRAERALRLVALNQEAIRKAAKKFEKRLPGTVVMHHALRLVDSSRQAQRVPELSTLVDLVKHDYHAVFGHTLEQYEEVEVPDREQSVWHARWEWCLAAAVLFVAVLWLPIFPGHPAAHRCCALFVLAITLWVTEAIPFFCTAMLLPLVAVPLGVVADPLTHEVLAPAVAARLLLSRILEHVQVLVIGGLVLAKALSKVHFEERAAEFLHRYTARHPSLFMLGLMVLACVLCAFVSNVAAPVLMLSVAHKMLWRLPKEQDEAARCILLGLAFSCNLGGMLSPIASPQNAVALQVLSNTANVSFMQWVLIASPLVFLTLVLAWAALLLLRRPFATLEFIPLVVPSRSEQSNRNVAQEVVVGTVAAVTIGLWCSSDGFLFGDPGIVALIPVVVFFGLGILKKEDFNTLSWHLVFLLAGGNILGTCAMSSGMLDIFTSHLQVLLRGHSPYAVLCLVVGVLAVATTFISHTVAAMVMLPLVAKLGRPSNAAHWHQHAHDDAGALPDATLLVLSAVFMCSGAMAFPISSFPNVNSLLAEDTNGQPYLRASDFILPGALLTLLCLVGLVTYMVPWTAFVLGTSLVVGT